MNSKFTKIKNELIISDMKDSKFRILCYLIARSKNGKCFPSIRTIASDLKKGYGTVDRAIDELISDGIIVKENRTLGTGKKTSNMYVINQQYLSNKKADMSVIEEVEEQPVELLDYNWLEEEE